METYRLTKITIPILVLLALVIFGTFYSCADMFVRWRLGFKYRSFLWFLLWLPYFRYDKKAFKFFMGSILVSFFVSYIYTVFFNDNLVPYSITPVIPYSSFVAIIFSFVICEFINSIESHNLMRQIGSYVGICFITYWLICINSEKIGVAMMFLPFCFFLKFVPRHFVGALVLLGLLILPVFLCLTIFRNNASFARIKNDINTAKFNNIYLDLKNAKTSLDLKDIYVRRFGTSIGWRLYFDHMGLRFFKEKPFLGYGTGSWGTCMYNNNAVDVCERSMQKLKSHPHNEWILTMVQWGILGIIAMCLWHGYIFTFALKHWHSKYALLLLIVNLQYIIAGYCDGVFHNVLMQTEYLSILAVLLACILKDKVESKTNG